jgi:RNA polymerase sigma factor (sigma-70 family)
MAEQKGFNIHQDLINRCRKGDRLAQEELYRLYFKAMYNTSLRMLNDRFEAEDVMQEAFLAAFTKLGQYRGEMSFGSWLKKIVINKTIDVLRSRKVRFEELDEKQEDEDLPEFEMEHVTEESAHLVHRIREAVKLLPEGFRIVLSLALFEGYDHEEIAMILGISESTSRSQLARAKKKLVEYLKHG